MLVAVEKTSHSHSIIKETGCFAVNLLTLEQEELSRALDFRDQIMSILSHDLRNPLNAVKLSSEALLRTPDAPDAVTRQSVRISRAADRMPKPGSR